MLPKVLNEIDLQDMFSCYGELREVHLMKTQDGTCVRCVNILYILIGGVVSCCAEKGLCFVIIFRCLEIWQAISF